MRSLFDLEFVGGFVDFFDEFDDYEREREREHDVGGGDENDDDDGDGDGDGVSFF